MWVVQVPKLALQSELFLCTRRHGTGFTVVHYHLIIYHCAKLLFSYVYVGLSSINIPTNVSLVYFHHNHVEANIKNRLPHNFSLFTTLCPSKIWQLNLKKQTTCSNSAWQSRWCCVIRAYMQHNYIHLRITGIVCGDLVDAVWFVLIQHDYIHLQITGIGSQPP